jgi:Fe-S oxidoreductase
LLTLAERIIFISLAVVLGGLTVAGFYGILKIIRRGRTAPPLRDTPRKLVVALIEVGLQKPIFRARPVLSTFHAFIFFGFSFYFLVNVVDVLEGFIPGFALLYGGRGLLALNPIVTKMAGLANLFNLTADILSVLTLAGMVAFLVRRFLGRDRRLTFNARVLLHPQVKRGWVRKDSAIVGGFILIHVGSRFMGQVLRLAEHGQPDRFMPFASLTANLFGGLPASAYTAGIHFTWWLAIGLILVFLPYFVRSKHIHLMVAPLNLGLARPNPPGQLDPATPNGDGSQLLPGARTLPELAWPRLLDAYACIMCNRCQDVCPAHSSGTALSPAALEVNKRYLINEDYLSLATGAILEKSLLEHAIRPEAVWACTTCYACVRVCPVGNEPMADIVDIRRRMIYDGDEVDPGIQAALESIGKNGNWFGKGSRARARWTKDLEFKIKDVTREPAEYLWFVGDTASFDTRVVPLTQKVARILNHAGLDYGILYQAERNAGNDVRRVGEEGLFEMLVEDNLKALGQGQFSQLLTTDPHSLNVLRNEYPQYGGMWPVHHYTNILLQLVESGQLKLKYRLAHYRATYHDPCYLGRYNGGYQAPRKLLDLLGSNFVEMPRNKENSYCCGAGGGQIWMSVTPDGERPAENRIREALAALSLSEPKANGKKGAGPDPILLFVVACPKDVIMYTDAVKTTGNEGRIEVRDIVQLVEEALGWVDSNGQPHQTPTVEGVSA